MQICSNPECIKNINKIAQSGSTCSHCTLPLVFVESKKSFNFFKNLSLPNFNFGQFPKKIILISLAVLSLLIVSIFLYKSLSSTVIPVAVSVVSDIKIDSINTSKLYEYIKGDDNTAIQNLLTNYSIKDGNNLLSSKDADYTWQINKYSTETKSLEVSILPSDQKILDLLIQNKQSELKKYINENDLTLNYSKISIKDWHADYSQTKDNYLVMPRDPKFGTYQKTIVFTLNKPQKPSPPPTPKNWTINSVIITLPQLPDIQARKNGLINNLIDLIKEAQKTTPSKAQLSFVFGNDLNGEVVVLNKTTYKIENYFNNLHINCPKCNILPLECTPTTEIADENQNQNLHFKTIKLIEYPK